MFWLDRKRGQPGSDESSAEEGSGAHPGNLPSGRRAPAPHVVVSGRQLREEILSYGPAFLEPHRFSEPDAFRALVTVLAAYALGSRTAARLVRERQMADPAWQPPSRREAMQVVSSLNRLRQYLPYLLGQRMQASQGGGPRPMAEPTPPPTPVSQYNPSPIPQPAASAGFDGRGEPPVAGPEPTSYAQPPVGAAPSYVPPPPPGAAPSYVTPPPVAAATTPGFGQPQASSHTTRKVNNYHPTEAGMHPPRPVRVAATPQKISRPVVNARPAAPRASGVVVRPVISLNRRKR